jgi:cell division protein FtsW (lipid II flippase)
MNAWIDFTAFPQSISELLKILIAFGLQKYFADQKESDRKIKRPSSAALVQIMV